jgi:hypothetical protein
VAHPPRATPGAPGRIGNPPAVPLAAAETPRAAAASSSPGIPTPVSRLSRPTRHSRRSHGAPTSRARARASVETGRFGHKHTAAHPGPPVRQSRTTSSIFQILAPSRSTTVAPRERCDRVRGGTTAACHRCSARAPLIKRFGASQASRPHRNDSSFRFAQRTVSPLLLSAGQLGGQDVELLQRRLTVELAGVLHQCRRDLAVEVGVTAVVVGEDVEDPVG